MKRILGFFFFYTLLAVLVLPLAASLLLNGFATELPRQAEIHLESME